MNREEFIKGIGKENKIVSICEFGSYRTEYWVKDRSDIDLLVVTMPNITMLDTLDIEDEIKGLAKELYNYDNIHLTFIRFSDFGNKYARMAVDSDFQYIINEERWYDFTHYVLKAARNNERLEKILKKDEQYSYFGGIIDESIL